MENNGIIGAVALIILFLFISFIIFIIKLSLDLRAHKNPKVYHAEPEPKKEKSPPIKAEPKKEVMYLVEKPHLPRTPKREREYSLVSPKRIYMIDKEK